MSSTRIGIQTALGVEARAVKSVLKEVTAGRGEWAAGSFREAQVFIIRSGVGEERARTAMLKMLADMRPSAVMNVGIAGALSPGVRIGDIVIGEIVFSEPASEMAEPIPFRSDTRLYGMAVATSRKAGLTFHQGKIVSVRQVVAGGDRKARLFGKTSALCADMEAAAVADVCEQYGLPFLAVKAISDLADESLGFDLRILKGVGESGRRGPAGFFLAHPLKAIQMAGSFRKSLSIALQSIRVFSAAFLTERERYIDIMG